MCKQNHTLNSTIIANIEVCFIQIKCVIEVFICLFIEKLICIFKTF